jgi:hypothetical protein
MPLKISLHCFQRRDGGAKCEQSFVARQMRKICRTPVAKPAAIRGDVPMLANAEFSSRIRGVLQLGVEAGGHLVGV